MENTIEKLFQEQLDKIKSGPIHPFFQKGIMCDDKDDPTEIDGETIDEMDKELKSYFGDEYKLQGRKITDDVDILPIERMEKQSNLEDTCSDVAITVTSDGDLVEQLEQLMNLMQLSQAPGTKRVHMYAWRSWVGWLDEMKVKHAELKEVDPSHPGKNIFCLYLLQMRVLYGYSHSTGVNCFYNQLCSLLREEKGIDLKTKMGDFVRKERSTSVCRSYRQRVQD